MPYKDLERKKEWERLHRPQRLARRRELRRVRAAAQTTRPAAIRPTHGRGLFLVPLITGGALASQSPKLGIGAGALVLVVAAIYKKGWAWWAVGCVTLLVALLFYFTGRDTPDTSSLETK